VWAERRRRFRRVLRRQARRRNLLGRPVDLASALHLSNTKPEPLATNARLPHRPTTMTLSRKSLTPGTLVGGDTIVKRIGQCGFTLSYLASG
jgi:hypothetical protein